MNCLSFNCQRYKHLTKENTVMSLDATLDAEKVMLTNTKKSVALVSG